MPRRAKYQGLSRRAGSRRNVGLGSTPHPARGGLRRVGELREAISVGVDIFGRLVASLAYRNRHGRVRAVLSASTSATSCPGGTTAPSSRAVPPRGSVSSRPGSSPRSARGSRIARTSAGANGARPRRSAASDFAAPGYRGDGWAELDPRQLRGATYHDTAPAVLRAQPWRTRTHRSTLLPVFATLRRPRALTLFRRPFDVLCGRGVSSRQQ
jgi:hypothetical protein